MLIVETFKKISILWHCTFKAEDRNVWVIPENDVVLEREEVQVAVYADQFPVLEHWLSENKNI
jgi:hypothetical protein